MKTSNCSPKISLKAYWEKMSLKAYWDYLGLLVGSFFDPTLEQRLFNLISFSL